MASLPGNPAPQRIAPFCASLRIYSRLDNRLVGTIHTDIQGKFTLKLHPGEYHIIPDIMRGSEVLAPGDARGIIIIGYYEAAPPMDIRVESNHSLAITIVYEMQMGN